MMSLQILKIQTQDDKGAETEEEDENPQDGPDDPMQVKIRKPKVRFDV